MHFQVDTYLYAFSRLTLARIPCGFRRERRVSTGVNLCPFQRGDLIADSCMVDVRHRYMLCGHSERVVWIELSGQVSELTVVVRIFKQHGKLCVETDNPHVFVFVEEILHHKYRMMEMFL